MGADFRLFACRWICVPSVAGSWAYYYYKYGAAVWCLDWQILVGWVNNACMLVAMGAVSWTANISLYCMLLALEKVIMPVRLQTAVGFPLDVMETYFKQSVYTMYVLGCVILVTVPIWMKAYHMNMKLVQRKGHISLSEMCMEIVFHTCQWATTTQFTIPAVAVLAKLGLRNHVIHYVAGIISMSLASVSVRCKFLPFHKMFHKIPALYNMAHYEHHVSKSIHPTTSGAGVWETFVFAGEQIPCMMAFFSIPYVSFFLGYFGVSFVAHIMIPDPRCAQWHTLHHVAVADVYGLNLPTKSDELHSVDFPKYDPILRKTSLLVQHWWATDAVAVLLACVAMVFFHYGMGWSIVNVWHTAQWGELPNGSS